MKVCVKSMHNSMPICWWNLKETRETIPLSNFNFNSFFQSTLQIPSRISLRKKHHSWLLLIITRFTKTVCNCFPNFNRTKPPHILTHAGAFLRPILVAHDHRTIRPTTSSMIETFRPNFSFCDLIVTLLSLINRYYVLLYYILTAMDSWRIVSSEWKRLELLAVDPLSRAGIPTPLHHGH